MVFSVILKDNKHSPTKNIASPLPALKQSTHKYKICCHITNNDTCTILIRDFNKEQHELPEDDKQCAIETCRRILSVLV
jgi:recombinational DNA repair protein RecR